MDNGFEQWSTSGVNNTPATLALRGKDEFKRRLIAVGKIQNDIIFKPKHNKIKIK